MFVAVSYFLATVGPGRGTKLHTALKRTSGRTSCSQVLSLPSEKRQIEASLHGSFEESSSRRAYVFLHIGQARPARSQNYWNDLEKEFCSLEDVFVFLRTKKIGMRRYARKASPLCMIKRVDRSLRKSVVTI